MTAGALPNERAEAGASWSPGGGGGGSGTGREEAGGARRRQVKAEAGLWIRDRSVARAGRAGERRWVGVHRPTGGAARRYRPTGSGIGTGTGAATALPSGCGESRWFGMLRAAGGYGWRADHCIAPLSPPAAGAGRHVARGAGGVTRGLFPVPAHRAAGNL